MYDVDIAEAEGAVVDFVYAVLGEGVGEFGARGWTRV